MFFTTKVLLTTTVTDTLKGYIIGTQSVELVKNEISPKDAICVSFAIIPFKPISFDVSLKVHVLFGLVKDVLPYYLTSPLLTTKNDPTIPKLSS